jgi:purine-cytosine permease-like protein
MHSDYMFSDVLLQRVSPVPIGNRTDQRLRQLFFVWFSGNMNIGGFSVGTIGPLFFGFGLKDSLLVYLITNLM